MSGARAFPTVRGMATAILPCEPALAAAARGAVEDDVSRYVAGQIAAMPGFLRLPVVVALHAFDWLAVLRHGRRFRALPVAARASWLAAWSEAPFAAMRDLVKLVRSSALLVYFDHPLVRERLESERRAGGAAAGPHRAAHG